MKERTILVAVILAGTLAACGPRQPPAPSVDEFVENSILLEATMVRCAQDRSKNKYDADCVNAREAANRLATREEAARREELQAQFERKRRALRRTQEAAAEARRQAEEEQRRLEEAEYLGFYETGPAAMDGASEAVESTDTQSEPRQGQPGDNHPGIVVEPPDADTGEENPSASGGDIKAIREELKRRQDEGR